MVLYHEFMELISIILLLKIELKNRLFLLAEVIERQSFNQNVR